MNARIGSRRSAAVIIMSPVTWRSLLNIAVLVEPAKLNLKIGDSIKPMNMIELFSYLLIGKTLAGWYLIKQNIWKNIKNKSSSSTILGRKF